MRMYILVNINPQYLIYHSTLHLLGTLYLLNNNPYINLLQISVFVQ